MKQGKAKKQRFTCKFNIMESKKNKKQSIERYYGLLTEVGLVVSLSLTFMAFKVHVKPHEFLAAEVEVIDEPFEFVPNTIEKREKMEKPKEEPIFKEKKPIFILKPGPEETFIDSTAFTITDDFVDLPNEKEIFGEYDSLPQPVLEPWMLSKMPEFPGGMSALADFLRQNLKYPTFEKELGISGKVTLRIEINEQGFVQNVVVEKGSTENFDAEALRVCKKIPRWKPGKQGSNNVKCWFLVPIVFKTHS